MGHGGDRRGIIKRSSVNVSSKNNFYSTVFNDSINNKNICGNKNIVCKGENKKK